MSTLVLLTDEEHEQVYYIDRMNSLKKFIVFQLSLPF